MMYIIYIRRRKNRYLHCYVSFPPYEKAVEIRKAQHKKDTIEKKDEKLQEFFDVYKNIYKGEM